jgi:hypothetical protein
LPPSHHPFPPPPPPPPPPPRQAIELLVREAKPISVAQAQAREQIWTPESAEPAPAEASSKLWTPES